MLMFGPLSFQKNSRLNLKLHRLGSDHNLVGGELDLVGGELELVGGELDLVGGELDQVQSKWGRTRWGRTRHGAKPVQIARYNHTESLAKFCVITCDTKPYYKSLPINLTFKPSYQVYDVSMHYIFNIYIAGNCLHGYVHCTCLLSFEILCSFPLWIPNC